MERPAAAAAGDVSLHNFSARLWEQLVHFHVMRLTDSLFLWVGATPHLRNLAVAMCTRYVSGRGAGRGREGMRKGEGRWGPGGGGGGGAGGAGSAGGCAAHPGVSVPPHGWSPTPPPVSGWSVGVPAGPLLSALTLPGPGVACPCLFPAGSSLTAFVYVSRTDLSPALSLCCPIAGVLGVLSGSPDPRPLLQGRPSRGIQPLLTSLTCHLGPALSLPRPRSPLPPMGCVRAAVSKGHRLGG